MSAIGDRLRQAAEEADSNESFVAFAVIVTANSSFRAFADKPEDEDEARALVARSIVNILSSDEQTVAAATWGDT
jgi:hypothetical protein